MEQPSKPYEKQKKMSDCCGHAGLALLGASESPRLAVSRLDGVSIEEGDTLQVEGPGRTLGLCLLWTGSSLCSKREVGGVETA